MLEICKKCKAEITQNYCSICGHPRVIKRVDGKYLLHELRVVFSFEKGFLFTTHELLIRPGKNIRDFLIYDRSRLIKPIVFLLIASLIYSAGNNFFLFEEGYSSFSESIKESAVHSISKWIQGNYGYANIIMSIFIAVWIKLFFRKQAFNIFEILVLLCYIMGVGMLIFAIFGIIQSLTGVKLLQVAGVVGFIYTSWAIGQFYGKDKFVNYIKAFFAYIFGMFTFMVTTLILGIVIDLF